VGEILQIVFLIINYALWILVRGKLLILLGNKNYKYP